jgi:hypothetical protein
VTIVPEYGDEGLMSEEEERVREESSGPLPAWEDTAQGEVDERRREDEEFTYLDVDGNEAHAAGQVCELCGGVIAPDQDARRRLDGRWMHESCPPVPAG